MKLIITVTTGDCATTKDGERNGDGNNNVAMISGTLVAVCVVAVAVIATVVVYMRRRRVYT